MVSNHNTLTMSCNSCSFVAETASVNRVNSCKVAAATTGSRSEPSLHTLHTVRPFHYVVFVRVYVQKLKAYSQAIRRDTLNQI